MTYEKIIFVSEDNTFTSPAAEYIMKDKLKEAGKSNDIECISRGMVVLFPEPANPKGIAIAKSRGIDMEGHTAKPVDENMFGNNVLVLVMTDKIKASLYDRYKSAVNVYTIKEFLGYMGDIETPYGKGIKEYGDVYKQLEELMDQIISKIFRNG